MLIVTPIFTATATIAGVLTYSLHKQIELENSIAIIHVANDVHNYESYNAIGSEVVINDNNGEDDDIPNNKIDGTSVCIDGDMVHDERHDSVILEVHDAPPTLASDDDIYALQPDIVLQTCSHHMSISIILQFVLVV